MRTFTFVIHHEEESWWAECDEIRWIGGGDSLEELRSLLPEAVEFCFEDSDEELGPFEVVEIFAPVETPTQA